ncbi:MAG: PIG-L deacetylase family protein [Mycobacteriaceae bacterium]
MTARPAPGRVSRATDDRRQRRGVERLLILVAHPADADADAGGTVVHWTDAGIEVSYSVATSGDAGGFGDTPRHEMVGLREAEKRVATEVLSVHDVEFFGQPDGALYPTMELHKGYSRAIRRVRRHRVLIQSPEIDWRWVGAEHPDHRASGQAGLAAVCPDARNPFSHPALIIE